MFNYYARVNCDLKGMHVISNNIQITLLTYLFSVLLSHVMDTTCTQQTVRAQ